MVPLCLDAHAACKWLGTFSKIKRNDSHKEKRTELLSGIKRSSSRRSLSCSLSLPFSVSVISCVTSAHRCGNKGRASCPITSMKSERQTCVSKISRHRLFTWRATPASCCRIGWQRVSGRVFASQTQHRGVERGRNKLKLSPFCWWSSHKKKDNLCSCVTIWTSCAKKLCRAMSGRLCSLAWRTEHIRNPLINRESVLVEMKETWRVIGWNACLSRSNCTRNLANAKLLPKPISGKAKCGFLWDYPSVSTFACEKEIKKEIKHLIQLPRC